MLERVVRRAGVTCSLATNNVLNPFPPYGDGSLIRIAKLYANVCHMALIANLVAIDAANPAEAIATVAQPLRGSKESRHSVKRTRARLHRP